MWVGINNYQVIRGMHTSTLLLQCCGYGDKKTILAIQYHSLIHVEHLGQRDRDGGIVWVDLHDVGHIVPPFLYDFCVAQILGSGVSLNLLISKQDICLLVPID